LDIRRQNAMEHLLYKALFELSDTRAEFVTRLFSRLGAERVDSDATSEALLLALRNSPGDRTLFNQTLAQVFRLLIDDHGFKLTPVDKAMIEHVYGAFFEHGPAISYVFEATDDWHPHYMQLMNLSEASGRNWSYLGSESSYMHVRGMQLRNLIVPVVGDFAGPKALRAIGDYARSNGAVVDVFYVSNVEPYLFESDIWRKFYDNLMTLPITDRSRMVRAFFGTTVRACPQAPPPIRTPMSGTIGQLLAGYRDGAIRSQCDLIRMSR
jgi:hypothetical protein